MLTLVLVINSLIGLGCLFVAWRLWQLKRQLSQVADTLISVEQSVHHVLYPAPKYILMGQSGSRNLHQALERLEPQLQRVQQVIDLLGVGRFLWRRVGRQSLYKEQKIRSKRWG